MHTRDIRSIGTLNNADGSIALTLSLNGRHTPVFVSVPQDELDQAGDIEHIRANPQIAVDWYHKRGAGRCLDT